MLQDGILLIKKKKKRQSFRAYWLKPLTLTGTGTGKIIKMFSFRISNYNSSLSKGIKKIRY